MATNPSIILSGNNFNDLLTDQRAKLAQAQAQQTAAQIQNLQLAQQKQAFEDDKNFRAAFVQAQGDPELTIKTAARLGVSPTKIATWQKSQAELAATLQNQKKAAAETDKTELQSQDLKHSQIYGAIQPLLSAKPEEFEPQKQFIINDLVNKHVLTPDEAKQYSGMTQDQVKFANAHLLNVEQLKAKAEGEAATSNAASAATQAQVAVDKQADAHTKTIQETQEKARVDSASKLALALQQGGLAGYAKAIQGIDPQVIKDNQFPTPEAVAAMPPGQAIKGLSDMAMTTKERVDAQHAQDTLAQQKAYQDQEIKLRQRAEARQDQLLGLERQKTQAALFQAGLGADGKPLEGAGSDLLKQASQNTSDGKLFIDQDAAFKGMSKGQVQQLRSAAAQAGIPLLSAKDAAKVKDVDSARNQIVNLFDTFKQNAQGHNNPITRYAASQAGMIAGLNPELKAADKDFLGTVEILKSVGGAGSGVRITNKEIENVQSLRPTLTDNPAEIDAKLKRVNDILTGALQRGLHDVPVKSSATSSAPAESGGNVVSISDVSRIAKDNKVSPEEVAAEYRRKGWIVK